MAPEGAHYCCCLALQGSQRVSGPRSATEQVVFRPSVPDVPRRTALRGEEGKGGSASCFEDLKLLALVSISS